jgi:hypothetical protein
MTQETERRKQTKTGSTGELVTKYREIGISAVAAASRYQRADVMLRRPRYIQAKSSSANGDASLKYVRTK